MSRAEPAALRRLITERVAAWSGLPAAAIAGDRPLVDFGMSSRHAVALAGELARTTGRALPATLLWETPTVDGLVERLGGRTAPQVMCVPRASAAQVADEPIAVVGVGCRLPGGVADPVGYWRLLTDGTDAVRRVPEGRWRDFTTTPPEDANPWGGYLDDDAVAGFDAEFFHVTPREAAAMDPQQRMLLEVVHEALDHAAIPAASLAGTATGVFVGVSAHDYGHLTGADPATVDPWAATGAATGVAAGRIGYVLDLRGPSVAVDTACSSSLVAVHQACAALRAGECDTALAAGANVLLSPSVTVAFGRAGALAPDGRCKPFSDAADGIGRAEGCAAIVLKRLPDALRDGDRVLAVVRSTAVNSDGRSNGLMAPNPEAQRALLETAYARAGIDPVVVDYVEAHGTGTPLGDPIEAGALADVLGRDRDPDQPLLIGSVKSNLGHLEAAAGLAGLVKTVLALHHDTLPGTLHCDRSALPDERLRVVTEPEPWPRYGGTALAGVSAFGFGGTNAHVVLEEWRHVSPSDSPTPEAPVLLPLSDASPQRVRDTAARLAGWLETEGRTARLRDVSRTLFGRTGRGPARAAVVARERGELADALRALAAGRPDPRTATGEHDLVGPGPVWVFSGYGTQWAGMGRQLLATEPAFTAAVEKLEPVLADACGISLHKLLDTDSAAESLETAQPLLYGMQLALAELWRSYGVEPAAVIGHSMGEVAAAVVAGALDPADGARVMAVRSRLLATLRGGAMAVADLDDDEAAALERDFPGVHVAVHSSPGQKVVTGEAAAVRRLADHLTARGRLARVMPVQGAGHSPQVDPLLPELAAALADTRGRDEPTARVYSTVHDDPRAASLFDGAHWTANLRRPVRLAQAVAAARADGHTAFVEISPHPAVLHPVTQTVPDAFVLPTLRRDTDPALTFHRGLAALHAAGQRLPRPDGRVADVPLPPWRHTRHWWTDTHPSPAARAVRDITPSPGDAAAVRPGDGMAGAPPGPDGLTAHGDGTTAHGNGATAHGDGTTAHGDGPAPHGDGTTERLIHHIAAVTGHLPQQIGPDTRLTDLGLDSLMATRIRSAVEREFGSAPSLRELLQAGTVGAVAERLARPPLLRALNGPAAGSARPPLFLAHAAGGTSDVYRQLAGLLGPGQPVHGLERIEEAGTVTAKAERYAEALRAARPQGPYRIGGWSFGGFVAQETARLLAEDGAEVEAVVLIDSVRPLPRPAARTEWDTVRAHFEGFAEHALNTYGARLDLPCDELAAMDDGARIGLVLQRLSAAADIPPAALEHQRASYLDMRIGEAHTPRPYDGRVILYRATEPAPHTVRDAAYERDDDALGWDEVCPRLEVVRVPGHHLSLLDPPYVNVIADHLSRALG